MVEQNKYSVGQPLISVIVPIYKVEEYINRCVDSILGQTYTNLEVILVDDGSPDRCGEICDEYAEMDARIRVIHQENAGVSEARNKGLSIAQGEYIAFVDADDYVNEKLFLSCYAYIKKWKPDLIDWGITFVNCEGKNVREQLHTLPKNELLTREIIINEIIPQLVHTQSMNSSFLGAWVWNKLFKKEIVQQYGIKFDSNIKLWEDGIFTIEYLKYCHNIVCMKESYYYYYDTPNSLSTKHDSNLYRYALNIYGKYRNLYSDVYDFNNINSKKYRFELTHGLIMRILNFTSNGVLSYNDAKVEIVNMFNDPKFDEFFTDILHKTPFIFAAQIAVKKGYFKIATNLYIMYHKIKSIK